MYLHHTWSSGWGKICDLGFFEGQNCPKNSKLGLEGCILLCNASMCWFSMYSELAIRLVIIKGTSHDSLFKFSLFSTLTDIFAV